MESIGQLTYTFDCEQCQSTTSIPINETHYELREMTGYIEVWKRCPCCGKQHTFHSEYEDEDEVT